MDDIAILGALDALKNQVISIAGMDAATDASGYMNAALPERCAWATDQYFRLTRSSGELEAGPLSNAISSRICEIDALLVAISLKL